MSKRLKNMKFMKRKSNTEKRKTKQNDKKAKIEAMQWIQSEAAESNLIIDDRRDEYMMYRTGRKSFGQFNAAVEKMQNESTNTIIQHHANKNRSNKSSASSNSNTNTNDEIKNENKTSKKRKLSEIEIKSESKTVPTKRQKTCTETHDSFIRPEPLQQ